MTTLILTWAWQSSAVAGVVLVIAAASGRRRTGWREAMLVAAALKFLVPPIVLPLPAIFPAPSFTDPSVVASAAARGPTAVVGAIYGAGACIVLLMLVISQRRAHRLVAGARCADAAMLERTATLAARVGLRRRVDLRISSAAAAPFAASVFRPVVVVPARMLASMTAGEIDAVIVHELAHHVRGHVVSNWIRGLLCAAWWWNPLAWKVSAALRSVHEDVSDDAVLRWSGLDADRYCDVLLRAARSAPAPSIVPALADRAHPRGARLRRLIDGATAPAPRWQVWALAIVLAALILPSRAPIRDRAKGSAADIIYRDVYSAISAGGAPAEVAARIAGRVSQRHR